MARFGDTTQLDHFSRMGSRKRSHSTKYIIDLSEAAETISQLLMEYGDEISGAVVESIEETAQYAQTMVSRMSPRSKGDGGRLGHYADGWEVQIERHVGTIDAVIYQANKPTIAHLLEDGWLPHGGTKRKKGIKHIQPTQESANAHLVTSVIARIK